MTDLGHGFLPTPSRTWLADLGYGFGRPVLPGGEGARGEGGRVEVGVSFVTRAGSRPRAHRLLSFPSVGPSGPGRGGEGVGTRIFRVLGLDR